MEALGPLFSEPVLTDSVLARGGVESVTHAAFDPSHEALWTATDCGTLSTCALPELHRYGVAWRTHPGPVVALLPLPGAGAAVTLSPTSIRVHTLGCVQQLARDTPPGETADGNGDDGPPTFSAAALEHGHSVKVVVGRTAPYLQLFDCGSDTFGARVDITSPCTVLAQGGRLLTAGHASGELSLRDTRARLKCEASLVAHSGGVVSLSAKGDVLVSTGLAPASRRRMPQSAPSLEPVLKVWDIRGAPKPLAQLPFPGGPAAFRFLPRLSTTLLVLSHGGFFTILDAASPTAVGSTYPVDTDSGAALLCVDIAPSGEAVAIGDAAGIVHLHATNQEPRVSMYDAHLEPPAPRTPVTPAGTCDAEDVVVASPPAALGDGAPLLSDMPDGDTVVVGLPPRYLEPSVLRDMRTVDFVGYVPNPHHKRGLPPGAAAAAVAPLRNARVSAATRSSARDGRGGAAAGIRRRPQEANCLPAAYHYTDARAAGPAVPLGKGERAVPGDASSSAAGASVQRVTFDYDFTAFNSTRLAGLENDLADAVVNPLVQLLYYQPHARASLLRHVCDREFCLSCEMGFLANSLRVSGEAAAASAPNTCRAANLVRSLRQVREAAALGVLEACDEPGYRPEPSLVRRAQALARFVLEQLAKEEAATQGSQQQSASAKAAPAGALERVFAVGVRTTTTCAQCGSEAPAREGRSLALDIVYPVSRGRTRPRFADVLAQSLRSKAEVRAWCDTEKGYTKANSAKSTTSLPPCLLLCANIREPGDMHWWGVSDGAIAAGVEAAKRNAAVAAGKAPDDDAAYNPLDAAPVPERWLPHAVRVTLASDGGVHVKQADSAAALQSGGDDGGSSRSVVYELTGMIACIRPRVGEEETVGMSAPEVQRRTEGHLVSLIRVGPPYVGVHQSVAQTPGKVGAPTPGVSPLPPTAAMRAGAVASAEADTSSQTAMDADVSAAPPSSPISAPHAGDSSEVPATPAPDDPPKRSSGGEWVVFNDFTVTPTTADEVSTLYGCSKVPCVLLFSRVEEAPDLAAVTLPGPVVTEAHYTRLTRSRPALPGATFKVLDMAVEKPRPGMLVGIDAEFVALSPAEKSIRPDGTEVVLRPPRLGLGRVSVVRGDGPSSGMPLQDDYIRSVEPVHDYLTRFSGLLPADLDPQMCGNRHGNGVTTLKAAYLKLRYLVDAGCVFCGHGLASDFRCINLVVPPAQVVDTVELFHFKRQRKLSLRFLARRLLGIDIQQGSHDSIEDARTALRLYAKYNQLQQEGTFRDVLLELYRHGKAWGWDGGGPT